MGAGGGIYNGAHNLTLEHVTIDHNYASAEGGGGGLAHIDSNPQITNAVFLREFSRLLLGCWRRGHVEYQKQSKSIKYCLSREFS